MANVAYIRVSTEEQNEDRQREALKKFDIGKWFVEKKSAKNTERPELQKLLEYVREGDTVYIHDLSRLARSIRDLLKLIDFFQQKKVHLVSNKDSIDTSTAYGELMLTIIGAINQFERQNMLERQREGIEIAKKKGIYKGRKKIQFPKNWGEVYEMYRTREITAVDAMKKLGLKNNTFYKLVKEHKAKIEEQQARGEQNAI